MVPFAILPYTLSHHHLLALTYTLLCNFLIAPLHQFVVKITYASISDFCVYLV